LGAFVIALRLSDSRAGELGNGHPFSSQPKTGGEVEKKSIDRILGRPASRALEDEVAFPA